MCFGRARELREISVRGQDYAPKFISTRGKKRRKIFPRKRNSSGNCSSLSVGADSIAPNFARN